MSDPTPIGSASDHVAHGKVPCACEQQSLGALPWMAVVLLALLVLQFVRARKSRAGAGGGNEPSRSK